MQKVLNILPTLQGLNLAPVPTSTGLSANSKERLSFMNQVSGGGKKTRNNSIIYTEDDTGRLSLNYGPYFANAQKRLLTPDNSRSNSFDLQVNDLLENVSSTSITIAPLALSSEETKEYVELIPTISEELENINGSKLVIFTNNLADDNELLSIRKNSDGFDNIREVKSPSSKKSVSADYEAYIKRNRAELLALPVCIIAPQASYAITPDNLYDYDLPPGLVTLRVVGVLMSLYRMGGRLTPNSVYKLLRLGFKSFSKRKNTSRMTVLPGERLTVVGDLHGRY